MKGKWNNNVYNLDETQNENITRIILYSISANSSLPPKSYTLDL